MKQKHGFAVFFVALLCVTAIPVSIVHAQQTPPQMASDLAVYPVWNKGGIIKLNLTGLDSNLTYYLWWRKPNDPAAHLAMPVLTRGPSASTDMLISSSDPPGTYLVTLSRSSAINTNEASLHFGVFGTDRQNYQRTEHVTIRGGGLSANSTVNLNIRSLNGSLPGYPLNLRASASGEFTYSLKLSPSANTGTLNVTVQGSSFDKASPTAASAFIDVKATMINFRSASPPPAQAERTSIVTVSYQITYPDNTPVLTGKSNATVVGAGATIAAVPLVLTNRTAGIWTAQWVPPPSIDLFKYHFEVNPPNFTDDYGNVGEGQKLISSDVGIIPAILDFTINANQQVQRTETIGIAITAKYHNGQPVSNFTNITGVLMDSGKGLHVLNLASSNGSLTGEFQVPANATLGSWAFNFGAEDPWGNLGSGKLNIIVDKATLRFSVEFPNPAERTTYLHINAKLLYPNGTSIPSTSTTKLTISVGNLTFTPEFQFNATALAWTANLYLDQNATLGRYNITITAGDTFGNSGNYISFTTVIPAGFRFQLPSNNATLDSLSNLALAVTVRYPNGTLLNNVVGRVNAYYLNSTGGLIVLPMAYNNTDGSWVMYFSGPEEGNFTFSFKAADLYGNAGIAANAFRLLVRPSPQLVTQRLIVAGVVGALVPIALLAWAIATISTRRRKHKP